MDYKIADLSENQRNKLRQIEDELNVVLIAWSNENNKEVRNSESENDRLH